MKLEILPANLNNLKTILNIQKECYQAEAELYDEYNMPPLTQDIESIEREFADGTLILKGEVDNQIVASVRGYTKSGTGYIGRLIVREAYQNNKFGQSLMRAIESQLDKCKRYELFTGFKSEKNLYLYEKLGYREFKRQILNDRLTLVYMEKKLN